MLGFIAKQKVYEIPFRPFQEKRNRHFVIYHSETRVKSNLNRFLKKKAIVIFYRIIVKRKVNAIGSFRNTTQKRNFTNHGKTKSYTISLRETNAKKI